MKKMLAVLCSFVLLLCILPSTTAVNEELRIGYAKVDITPQYSLPLAGYGNTFSRMSKVDSTGKTIRMDDNGDGIVDDNDGLSVCCIAARDGEGKTLLWFAFDMIGASEELVAKVQYRIAQKWNIPAECVVINASHTHSGVDLWQYFSHVTESNQPASAGSLYDADTENSSYNALTSEQKTIVDRVKTYLYEQLIPGFMSAAEGAINDLAPATISTGSISASNLNFIRHYYNDANSTDPADVYGDNTRDFGSFKKAYADADDMIRLIQFTRAGKEPVVAVDWRAHPKINSTATFTYGLYYRDYISSDYVNAFRYQLEQQGYKVSFFQGTAGNVNTFSLLHDSITNASNPTDRDTTQLFNNGSSIRTCQIGNLYGEKLADYALQALNNRMNPVKSGAITTQRYHMYADSNMRENYKMVGGENVKGMLYELVPNEYNSDGTQMNVYEYLQTYYAYVSDWASSSRKNTIKAYLDQYGINSVYHLGRIYTNFSNTMEKQSDGTYAYRSNTKGNFYLYSFTIGDSVACVTAPFELFCDLYADRANQNKMVFALGYTNGSKGYMPSEATYSFAQGRGAYEANNTGFNPGTAEAIAEIHKQMIATNEENGLPEICPSCGQRVTWMMWPGDDEIAPGHYYLPEDVITNQKSIHTGTVCLHLNGHSLSNTNMSSSRVLALYTGATLNVMGEGVIQSKGVQIGSSYYKNAGVVMVNSGATLNLHSGAIKRLVVDDQWTESGGVAFVGGTMNMYGGELLVEKASPTTNVTTVYGGVVYVTGTGIFNMTGGRISGGEVTTGGKGANLFVDAKGTISVGGTAQIDGGVYLSGAQMTLTGNPQIYTPDGDGVILGTTAAGLNAEKLESGAHIGITTCTLPQTIGRVSTPSQMWLFDYQGKGFLLCRNNILQVVEKRVGCPCMGILSGTEGHVCQDDMEWGAWSDPTSLPAEGSWYLTTDVTTTSSTAVQGELYLDLNGRTITSGGTSNIFTAGLNEKLSLSNGTLDASKSTASGSNGYGGAIGASKGSVVTLYGATVIGGQTTYGGGIYSSGLLNLYGTTVTSGSSTYGGGIYCSGGLTCCDSMVIENSASSNGGGIYIAKGGWLDLINSWVESNRSGTTGGGIYFVK